MQGIPQLNTQKTNDPTMKTGKDLHRHSSKESIQMASKNMEEIIRTTGCVEPHLGEPLLIVPMVVTSVLKNNELEGCEEMGNSFCVVRMKLVS